MSLRIGGLVSVLLAGVLACGSPGASDVVPAAEADPASLRQTTEGPVVGLRGPDASHVWLGIPFAKPPVGALRWRAPVAPERRSGTLEALRAGALCPQLTTRFGGAEGPAGTVVGSEDCLTLNVWAPQLAAKDVPQGKDRLPVMVWIHGGGNVLGHGAGYTGSRLASEQGLIVVTVNYRLGPLGWFRHAALRADANPRDASGNYATLDLIRALVWVRANAAAFGGDPARVTIFGESAGGANVYSLLASPLADGLFERAIVQSGGLRSLTPAEAENRVDAQTAGARNSSGELLLRLLVARGRAADRDAAVPVADAMPLSEVAELLRGAEPRELVKLYDDRPGSSGLIDVPQIFRDGHVLPEQELAEYLASREGLPRVPVILGTNRDESRLFQVFDPRSVRWLLGIFPRARDPQAYAAWSRYASGLWKAGGADEVAQSIVRAGARNVWVYRFDWDEEPSSWLADLSGLVGAAHGIEIPFVFGKWQFGSSSGRLFTPANEAGRVALSEAMMGYWARFAATGDPERGSGGQPRWERWSESAVDAPRSIVFDTVAGGGIRMSNEVTTRETLAARLARDAEFSDVAQRCAFASRLGGYGRGFEREQLSALGCTTPEVASPSR